MAIKKSALYSSLWASCDELRGGMDASQYKDYVLFMLFIKYISDKYADSDDFAPPVVIPPGASFRDMVRLKGKSDIGDRINKEVIQPLVDANSRLARSDFPDFNDPNKLGEGKAMVDRLTNLISIFEKPELDFSRQRAEHDDILGDAYEYLMRHFAQESGKSKGQFYTPAEVSRVIAKVIGIAPQHTVAATTAYDPTCGSGSLLLKVAAEAGRQITLEGQEKDVTTAGLARMNMILHNFPTATIMSGDTLASPKFKEGERLRTYDYVVANPPFSDKSWSNGLTPAEDPYQRFVWGIPPAKQGDYAYLLHGFIPQLIQKWEPVLGVKVQAYFLQRMKTRWGSCNPKAGHIRLNTELVKKPRDLIEYVVVHELIHLLEPTHNARFLALLSEHYPAWRAARAELNELPLGAEVWKE